MHFEHLVEINDPANPLVTTLSREDLWYGLICRAEDPRAFLSGLERCEILSRSETVLERRLDFGSVQVLDRVILEQGRLIVFESLATADQAGGTLIITIEEPQPEHLFLRFAYRTTLSENPLHEDGRYAEVVKSAYHQSDLDTVKVIRMIAESGRVQ